MKPDVLVVGAGIVGAACAYALSRERLRVTVVDAAFAGGGTTAAGMGHIVVMDGSEAELALTAYGRSLWEELAPQLPRSCEDEACGTIWVAADEEELELVRAKARTYAAHGVPALQLDAARLAELEPNLRRGLAGGLLVPGDRVLYPPAAARWLLARARDLGAEVREGTPVERLETRSAGAVVNAAGVQAARLTPGLPIEPRKGQLVITDRHPGFVRHQLVELGYLKSAHGEAAESVAFNVQPRATGQLLIGSSREYAGLDATLNRPLRDAMLRRALEFLPGLSRLSAIRTWTGFRPATPDKLPLIGRHSSGVFVAAGHEGLGITTAPATGALLADLLLGRPPAIDPRPYDVMRFAHD